jgi:acetyl-CoA carboxylase carboxyl transferase alpha subunit/acetyl-CoA carboxylase carboxyl transferase beta subunit
MTLRDFFKKVREKKFSSLKANTDSTINGLSDAEIAANWHKCKGCSATIYKNNYKTNLNVCPECNHHGRISSQARIESLVDKNSFQEITANLTSTDPLKFNDGKAYTETVKKAQEKTQQNDALITGFAKIDGVKVALAVMNFDFLGGSMGSVVGEKFTRLVEAAIQEKTAVISVSASGGARMHEGILSLMQMAKTSIALERLSQAGLLYISILTDPTYGGVSASFATLGDLIIAEPQARVGFAGRRVIEETVREKLPSDFQSAEYLLEHGQIDFIVERKDLKNKLTSLLRIHGYSPENVAIPDSPAALQEEQPSAKALQPKKEIALEFEKPLQKIQDEIKKLEKTVSSNDDKALLNKLNQQYSEVEKNIYKNLTAIDITKIARHPNRPNIEDYLNCFIGENKWIEMHGDRAGTDDQAILTALVEMDGIAFMAIGTRKGRNIKDNQKRNFGMPQPEGYRKAKRAFEHANKFNLPIVTFIDTPGAYPGLNAEANGQSIAIAENLKSLASLQVPVLSIVTGEGGSGGALAIGVANKIVMLENSVYSVISPEGCAAILWRTRDKAPEAAEALKITAKDLQALGIADEIVNEPLGGAHRNWEAIANDLREVITSNLKELMSLSKAQIMEQKTQKFYSFGEFNETQTKLQEKKNNKSLKTK